MMATVMATYVRRPPKPDRRRTLELLADSGAARGRRQASARSGSGGRWQGTGHEPLDLNPAEMARIAQLR